MIRSSVLKNKFPDFKKLADFGFVLSGDKYLFSTPICNGQFTMKVDIDLLGETGAEIIDALTNEPYTLHLVEDASGEFVGYVRSEYNRVLSEIAEKCFYSRVFASVQARYVIDYALSHYGDKLEFLWDKLPDAAVLRRKDTGKWYAVFMKISPAKLGLEGESLCEIADVRCNPENIPAVFDGKSVFCGYHMNKKHWITLLFNNLLSNGELEAFLEYSYNHAV